MSAPMDDMPSPSDSSDMDEFCEIVATVTSGLEDIAKEEANEKFGVDARTFRGRIVFQIHIQDIPKLLQLGCIENLSVSMIEVKEFPFSEDELESMRRLRELVKRVDWPHGLNAWNQMFSFHVPIATRPEVIPDVLGQPTLASRCHQKNKQEKASDDTAGSKSKRRKKNRLKWKKSGKQGGPEEGLDKEKSESTVEGEDTGDGSESHGQLSLAGGDEKSTVQVDPQSGKGNNGTEFKEEQKCEEVPPESVEESAMKKPRNKTTTHNPLLPSFRVTCNRTGENHSFDSMGAASNFGGAINEYFGWNVSMKNFDIEVLLNIADSDVRVSLALTKESMYRRNIVSFGPTTLRPTVAYSMLRLCKIQPGDVVCDPMCGSGSIPIQGSLGWPTSYSICGDIHGKGLEKTAENIDHINTNNKEKNEAPVMMDRPLRWNAHHLPLKTSSVDVFISDLPFGVRMGSMKNNWKLYPGAMVDMARVCTPDVGRATILTVDKKCFNKALSVTAKYWKCRQMIGFNLGGLAACIYCLNRTSAAFDHDDSHTWQSKVDATAKNQE